jgi:hypothetical protein
MKPRIDATEFGSITVEGTVFEHDVVISPDGEVSKRKKKLSKAVYGTSHTISLQEAKYIYRQAAEADRLVVGAGQYGRVQLSPEAAEFFTRKACEIVLLPTPQVIGIWNETEGRGGRAVPRHVLSSRRDATSLTTPRPDGRSADPAARLGAPTTTNPTLALALSGASRGRLQPTGAGAPRMRLCARVRRRGTRASL